MHEASESQFLCHVHQFENDILNVQNMIGIIQLRLQVANHGDYDFQLGRSKVETMIMIVMGCPSYVEYWLVHPS